MIIGIPKEIKVKESRVSCPPGSARMLVQDGHKVLIQAGAGVGSGFEDAAFVAAGAHIVSTAEEVWAAKMVIKVKEPIENEYGFLRDDLILFTYLHLAADRTLSDRLSRICWTFCHRWSCLSTRGCCRVRRRPSLSSAKCCGI